MFDRYMKETISLRKIHLLILGAFFARYSEFQPWASIVNLLSSTQYLTERSILFVERIMMWVEGRPPNV